MLNARFNAKFNTKPTHARQTAAVLALLCGLLSGASHARQAGAGAASAALEEVIVTATKREKAAQDVGNRSMCSAAKPWIAPALTMCRAWR